MFTFVVYVLRDYTHTFAITTNRKAAEEYKIELMAKIRQYVWIDEITVGDGITKLDCD